MPFTEQVSAYFYRLLGGEKKDSAPELSSDQIVYRILQNANVQSVLAGDVRVTVTPFQEGQPLFRRMITCDSEYLAKGVRNALDCKECDAVHFYSMHGDTIVKLEDIRKA